MRVVIDTNVLMSAILFGGIPGRILSAWRSGHVTLVMSSEIVHEYLRVSERLRERYPGVDAQAVLALIVERAEVVSDEPLPRPVCEDPDDDKFLACALTAGVDLVVSGDRKLLAVSAYRGVRVVTPRRFVDEWLGASA